MGWEDNAMDANITTIILALAVFTIALSYTPLDFIFRFFAHRKPTPEEILMMQNVWRIIAVSSAIVLIVWIVKTIIDGAMAIASYFPSDLHLSPIVLPLIIIALALGLLYLLIQYVLKTAKRITRKEQDIKLIAYHIWENEGCPNGHDVEHWQKAEIIWQERHKKGQR
jgi:hypothetical protein